MRNIHNIILFVFLSMSVQLLCVDLEHIKGHETISVAAEPDYPPFCLINEKGEATGFSVELFRASATAMHLEPMFKVEAWSVIKQELVDGKIAALPMVGRSPEREEVYDFTFPYYTMHGAIFVRKGSSGINNFNDLKDREIIVMKGDNAEEYALRENLSAHLISTESYSAAFKLLAAGKHDAVIAQRLMGLQLLRKLSIKNVEPIDLELTGFSQDFSFAVKDGNKELLAKLNEGLAIVIANGTYDEIRKKWFTPAMTYPLPLKEILKTAIYILIPLLILISIAAIFILRNQVKKQTRSLRDKMIKLEESERLVRESEAWFHSIIDQNPHFIFIKNEEGEFVNTNKAMADFFGTTSEVMKGGDESDFVRSITEINALQEGDKQILEGSIKRIDQEDELTSLEGEVKKFHTIKVPFTLLKSSGKAILGVSSDITELRKIEAELEKYQFHLEDLVKERTAELVEKNEKLEHFNQLFVGREFRIKELKDEIKELKVKLAKYEDILE